MCMRVKRRRSEGHILSSSMLLSVVLLASCASSPRAERSSRGDAGAVLTFELPQVDFDADVYVDGNYVGQVKEVQGEVRVAPGRHRVEVRKAGRFPIQKTLKIESSRREQTRQVRGELLANPLES